MVMDAWSWMDDLENDYWLETTDFEVGLNTLYRRFLKTKEPILDEKTVLSMSIAKGNLKYEIFAISNCRTSYKNYLLKQIPMEDVCEKLAKQAYPFEYFLKSWYINKEDVSIIENLINSHSKG